jgi:lipopolysaccharide/colanic/teichoic acid biosynthesis glycosyltransferase
MKRLFDVAGALGGLVFFGPVMLATAAAILLDDRGPILFRQVRIGRARRPFEILKFRSMRGGQVTRVGRVLRATGLDELPQFINILRGDLSAVGPRPLTGEDVGRLGWTASDCDFRWSVRPGLTGPAQLVGPESPRYSLRLDRRYIARRTLWFDVRMVAMSFLINALGKRRARRLLFQR